MTGALDASAALPAAGGPPRRSRPGRVPASLGRAASARPDPPSLRVVARVTFVAMARTFGGLVAARTRTARQILADPTLLALFEDKGGLRRDLEAIRDAGESAEAQGVAQSVAKGQSGGATLDVLKSFAAVQREYNDVMAVVQAVRGDLGKDAPSDLVSALDRILVNEAQVIVRTVEKEDGKKAREAARSTSQEALRAEIAKDAAALVALTAAHAALAERKVSLVRLHKLKDDADALAGKLAARATKKGAGKVATGMRAEAEKAQSAKWSSCYRILAKVGQVDQRVDALLKEAARPASKKKTA